MTEAQGDQLVHHVPTGDAVLPAMVPSSYVTEESLRDGDPDEREAVHLSSADGRFTVGTWRAEPYREFIECYPGDEYARIVDGSVTITGEDGRAQTFSAGDAYTMRRGWRGEYQVTQTLTKQFAFYVP